MNSGYRLVHYYIDMALVQKNSREMIVQKFVPFCTDMDPRYPALLERGCFNHAIEQCVLVNVTPTFNNTTFLTAYSAAVSKLLYNLDPQSLGKNGELASLLRSGAINPRFAATLPVDELNPQSLAADIDIIDRRKNSANTKTVSHRYKCPKCSKSSAYLRNEQIRCGDEASTGFADCAECNHTWKIY
jgi:DNA-directed RNA polymerase subunit M/transcription elongation factor TFIIS